MKIATALGAITTAVLFFFGLIFVIASSVEQTATRLVTGLSFFAVGIVVAYFTYLSIKKPVSIVQRLEISGKMGAAQIKCPHCSASIESNRIKVVSGVPYVTCPYCGTTFEITEEPKW
jgi:DNA-directed RNA polymerase subunit RPC12/RpoP